MNYQNNTNYCRLGCTRSCLCTGGALGFLVMVIAIAVSLILGATYYEFIVPATASIIAAAAALAAIIIAFLIYCRRRCC